MKFLIGALPSLFAATTLIQAHPPPQLPECSGSSPLHYRLGNWFHIGPGGCSGEAWGDQSLQVMACLQSTHFSQSSQSSLLELQVMSLPCLKSSRPSRPTFPTPLLITSLLALYSPHSASVSTTKTILSSIHNSVLLSNLQEPQLICRLLREAFSDHPN